MRIPRRGQEGFTFTELAVTVIVLGLLAALMIPVFLGTRDRAGEATAQALLRTGASAVEAASVDDEGFALLTTEALAASEPAVAWLDAEGADARANEISVSGLGPGRYTLTTTAADGTVFVLAKDRTATPAVTRTCGAGCTW
jgi:type IV pilus assembly protein PilA